MSMAPRRSLVLGAVGFVLASCGGDSSGLGSATGSIGSPTSEAGGTSVATDGPSTATAGPDGADVDVIVSAAVDGGAVSSVDIKDLVVEGGAGPDEPWLTFDLRLAYPAGAPSAVVFDRGIWSAPARICLYGCEDPLPLPPDQTCGTDNRYMIRSSGEREQLRREIREADDELVG